MIFKIFVFLPESIVCMNSRLEELKQFLAENPNDPFLKYALTIEYKKMGDMEKAMAGFQELVSQHENYVGTYYHFAKFLDENSQKNEALSIYKKGMEVAARVKNRHAYSELQRAYNLSMGIDEDDWED